MSENEQARDKRELDELDWREEVNCERCRNWEGKPPIPLSEARKLFPPEQGFRVAHVCYVTTDESGAPIWIPTTIVEGHGQTTQWFPELPKGRRPYGAPPGAEGDGKKP